MQLYAIPLYRVRLFDALGMLQVYKHPKRRFSRNPFSEPADIRK